MSEKIEVDTDFIKGGVLLEKSKDKAKTFISVQEQSENVLDQDYTPNTEFSDWDNIQDDKIFETTLPLISENMYNIVKFNFPRCLVPDNEDSHDDKEIFLTQLQWTGKFPKFIFQYIINTIQSKIENINWENDLKARSKKTTFSKCVRDRINRAFEEILSNPLTEIEWLKDLIQTNPSKIIPGIDNQLTKIQKENAKKFFAAIIIFVREHKKYKLMISDVVDETPEKLYSILIKHFKTTFFNNQNAKNGTIMNGLILLRIKKIIKFKFPIQEEKFGRVISSVNEYLR